MAATQPISAICERYRISNTFDCAQIGASGHFLRSQDMFTFPCSVSRGLSRRGKMKREERDPCRLPTDFLSRIPQRSNECACLTHARAI